MSTQSENSLMKKTKKELVDIILRKDDVEKQLRKEKADIELDFNKAKEMLDKKDNKIDLLNNANESLQKDINVEHEKEASLYNDINRLKTVRNAFAISATILFVAIIIIAII